MFEKISCSNRSHLYVCGVFFVLGQYLPLANFDVVLPPRRWYGRNVQRVYESTPWLVSVGTAFSMRVSLAASLFD